MCWRARQFDLTAVKQRKELIDLQNEVERLRERGANEEFVSQLEVHGLMLLLLRRKGASVGVVFEAPEPPCIPCRVPRPRQHTPQLMQLPAQKRLRACAEAWGSIRGSKL